MPSQWCLELVECEFVHSRILCSVLRCRHCARCVCFDQQRAQNFLPAQPAIVWQAAGVLCAVRSTYCCGDCMLPAATATCWHGAVSGGSCVILLACSDMWAQHSLWLLCACTCCAEHLQLVPSTSSHSVAVRCSSRLTVDKALPVHTVSGYEWDCTGLLVPSWPRFQSFCSRGLLYLATMLWLGLGTAWGICFRVSL